MDINKYGTDMEESFKESLATLKSFLFFKIIMITEF